MAIARPVDAPLYDPRYEHDACGVGFVADAGGRSAGRVLGLALAGLGSLGHRGAFAADGASSDGAGIAIPLEPDVLARLAPGVPGRPGIISVFTPAATAREGGRPRHRRARACGGAPACPGLADRPERSVRARSRSSSVSADLPPGDRRASGGPERHGLRATPHPRPAPDGDRGPGRRGGAGRVRRALGVHADRRLQGPRRRRPPGRALSGPRSRSRGQPRRLPPALRDEHGPRLAARPALPLARPQRRDQHRPREPRAGPGAGGRPG